MTGTYLTQCYFQHYDARLYRLSYLVYVIGPPASGKSFLADLDKVLMYAMKQQDETFRKMEKEYTEKKERNGLIRRFLPKGKRIDSYDEDTILGVELWANGLPRKILGYRTPDEAFEAEMDRIFAV